MNIPQPCELCGRSVTRRTRHHLIPKTRHKNKKNKRDFDRDEVKTRILMLCRPCHSTVHASLTEKELEAHYNTRETLASHPDVARFIEWIRSKPDGTTVPVRKARRDTPDRRLLRDLKRGLA